MGMIDHATYARIRRTSQREGVEAERSRCIAIIRKWIHGAPTTTTEQVLIACIEQIEAGPDAAR